MSSIEACMHCTRDATSSDLKVVKIPPVCCPSAPQASRTNLVLLSGPMAAPTTMLSLLPLLLLAALSGVVDARYLSAVEKLFKPIEVDQRAAKGKTIQAANLACFEAGA